MTTDFGASDDNSQRSDPPAEGGGRPRPGPGAQPPDFPIPVLFAPKPHRTRRWFLAGVGAVLLGAGGGVAAEFARKQPKPPPNPAPAALVSAQAAEEKLLLDAQRARKSSGADAARLGQLESNHRQHLQALRTALSRYDPPLPRGKRQHFATGISGPLSVSALREAESSAAREGAARAGQLRGREATLLASIAACEATHVELLT